MNKKLADNKADNFCLNLLTINERIIYAIIWLVVIL